MRHEMRASAIAERQVLFLAQLPPPLHGQAVVSEAVHGILHEEQGCTITRYWGGGAVRTEDVGRRSLRKYFGFGALLVRLGALRAVGQRFDLGYLGLVPWAHTAVRDVLLAGAARLLCRRVWVHVHGDGISTLLGGDNLRSGLARALLKGTELIVATSDTARAAEAAGIFSRVVYVPNLSPDPGSLRRGTRDELVVTCLCNLDPRKGVWDFINVVKAALDSGMPVRAFIVGGSTALLSVDEVRQRVAELAIGDAVTVTGRLEGAEKARILADSDVFLYLSRHDLAPLALIEGMAHGCAPLVLDIGGLREMVGDELEHNVLDPSLRGQSLVETCLARLEAYRVEHADLEADRQAARARFLQAYSPAVFRLRVGALLSA